MNKEEKDRKGSEGKVKRIRKTKEGKRKVRVNKRVE